VAQDTENVQSNVLWAGVPTKNLRLASSGSGPQGQTDSGRIAQPKVSLDSFHPIRILGEGFGKVILAKKKASNRCDQHFAINLESLAYISVPYPA
jgi:hypothetical protein